MPLSIPELEAEVLRLPWRAVFAEPLVRLGAMAERPAASATAAVPYLGTWSGWLRLRSDIRLVHEVAARVRGTELVRPADLDDAVRWLATVVAQGLQVVIDPAARLGPATVLDPIDEWRPQWCRPAARLLFASGDRVLGIALDERMPMQVSGTGEYASDLDVPTAAADDDDADSGTHGR